MVYTGPNIYMLAKVWKIHSHSTTSDKKQIHKTAASSIALFLV